MVYETVLQTELTFLEKELSQLKMKLRKEKDDDEKHLKLVRVYLATQKRYVELQKELDAARPQEDDPLLAFNSR